MNLPTIFFGLIVLALFVFTVIRLIRQFKSGESSCGCGCGCGCSGCNPKTAKKTDK